MSRRYLTPCLLIAVLLAACLGAPARETTLATMDRALDQVWHVASPAAGRVAYLQLDGGRVRLVVNGTPGPAYNAIPQDSVIFSPNGQHLVYLGIDGRQKYVVHDGKAVGPYDDVAHESLPTLGGELMEELPAVEAAEFAAQFIFSPDSRYLAFAARRGDSWRLVVAGKESQPYDEVGLPLFSPDGAKLACVVTTGTRQSLLLGGKSITEADAVLEPQFSLDSRRLACKVKIGDERAIVVDGVREPLYPAVSGFTFSPDGTHYAYVGHRREGQVLVVDGKETGSYPMIIAPPRFSPAGNRVACVIAEGDTQRVVVDGTPGPVCGRILSLPVFSPDGTRVAYAASQQKGYCVVVDGVVGKEYLTVGAPVFSADGKRVAYLATQNELAVAVVNGQESTAFDTFPAVAMYPGEVTPQPLLCLLPGDHLLFAGVREGKTYVVLDGKAYGPYGSVRRVCWSPDGARVAFIARQPVEVGTSEQVVVNGEAGPLFTQVADGSLGFSPDGARLAYIGIRDGKHRAVVNGTLGLPYHTILGSRLVFDPAGVRYLAFSVDRVEKVKTKLVGDETIETDVIKSARIVQVTEERK